MRRIEARSGAAPIRKPGMRWQTSNASVNPLCGAIPPTGSSYLLVRALRRMPDEPANRANRHGALRAAGSSRLSDVGTCAFLQQAGEPRGSLWVWANLF